MPSCTCWWGGVCLFYLLLLSLSEHRLPKRLCDSQPGRGGTRVACCATGEGVGPALAIGAILTGLYGYLYIL
jgi:hypothetical protein